MSVEPRNGLWNRLLARAEARAREQSSPETHHYRRVSTRDDHLRASLENSLVYHGLKIETEFNLRLQRPPRKRKAKRKRDLPVVERLRNDRAAAGSPGPTHRTPTGTPARRISKTTPLSRPPLPPPPLPPPPLTTRAAAARERVLSAISDDEEPINVRRRASLLDLTDSTDDALLHVRTPECDGGTIIVLPHFDQAANSNDTSSWEDHAILVRQPPPKEQDSGEIIVKNQEPRSSTPMELSSPIELGPSYRTSAHDRARRRRARKIASSESSPISDSDSENSSSGNGSAEKQKSPTNGADKAAKAQTEVNKDVEVALKQKTEKKAPKQHDEDSQQRKTSNQCDKAESAGAVNTNSSCSPPNQQVTLLNENILSRIRNLTMKGDSGYQLSSVPVFSLSSSSDDERSAPLRRRSPPMRAMLPRRRVSSEVTVEDKLFGPLSPLSSPRTRTRSVSENGKRISDGEVSPVEIITRSGPRRRSNPKTRASSASPESNRKRDSDTTQETPLRRSPRKSQLKKESEQQNCRLKVLATSPKDSKQSPPKRDSINSPLSNHRSQRKTVRKSAPRDTSSESWDLALELNAINVTPVSRAEKRRRTDYILKSSPRGRREEPGKAKRKVSNTRQRKKSRSDLLTAGHEGATDDDNAADQSLDGSIPRYTARAQKRARTASPSSSSSPVLVRESKKPSSLQRKSPSTKTKSSKTFKKQRIADTSKEGQVIHDSDSDVLVVSFSPAKGTCDTSKSPQNRWEQDVIAKGGEKKTSRERRRRTLASSSDELPVSLTSKPPKTGKRASRTSPRRSLSQRLPSFAKSSKRTNEGTKSLSESSDDAPKSRTAGPAMAARAASSGELSDSSFEVSWLGKYKGAPAIFKKRTKKKTGGSRKDDGERQVNVGRRHSRNRRSSSSFGAESSDSCMEVDIPSNPEDPVKKISKKEKRKKN